MVGIGLFLDHYDYDLFSKVFIWITVFSDCNCWKVRNAGLCATILLLLIVFVEFIFGPPLQSWYECWRFLLFFKMRGLFFFSHCTFFPKTYVHIQPAWYYLKLLIEELKKGLRLQKININFLSYCFSFHTKKKRKENVKNILFFFRLLQWCYPINSNLRPRLCF